MSTSREITIQGAVYRVPNRYAEGAVLTAGEANALNQTLAENIRNNFAASIKKLRGEGDAELTEGQIASIQSEIDAYASTYEFGIRQAREPLDPVEAQLEKDLGAAIRGKLRDKGQKPTAEQVADLIQRYRVERPEVVDEFRKEAKRKVDASRRAAAKLNAMLD